jgi:hypothetical protein
MARRRKKRGINKHHMTNKKHGGTSGRWNILMMRADRHRNLHHFFGNLRWEAIGNLLFYEEMWKRRAFRGFSHFEVGEALFSIFGRHDPMACVRLIDRVALAKGRAIREKLREAA